MAASPEARAAINRVAETRRAENIMDRAASSAPV